MSGDVDHSKGVRRVIIGAGTVLSAIPFSFSLIKSSFPPDIISNVRFIGYFVVVIVSLGVALMRPELEKCERWKFVKMGSCLGAIGILLYIIAIDLAGNHVLTDKTVGYDPVYVVTPFNPSRDLINQINPAKNGSRLEYDDYQNAIDRSDGDEIDRQINRESWLVKFLMGASLIVSISIIVGVLISFSWRIAAEFRSDPRQ